MKARLLVAGAATLALTSPLIADEGMWTFDAFPFEAFEAEYGWAPTQEWLDHVRLSTVKLNGCSASFVSGEGLIMTNDHCVVGCLADISNADHDYVKDGFIVASRAEEKQCPGQQAAILEQITDVSDRVFGAMGDLEGEERIQARTAEIATIESEACPDTEKYRCDVVSLFGGGQFKLYQYRKYDDVRIAWAPETAAQDFGGDPDNYNFPRFALDGAFLRAYEDGKPVQSVHHLEWTGRDPEAGEVIFVAGTPGRTQRLRTVAEMAYEREVNLPIQLATFSELRGRLIRGMKESEEHAREGKPLLSGIENELKRIRGRTQALHDPAFNAILDKREADLRAAVGDQFGDPWADVEAAMTVARELDLVRRYDTPSSQLFSYALTLVRAAEELPKDEADRLPGWGDASLGGIQRGLFAPRPVHDWIEEMRIEWSLSKAREYLGPDHPQVKLLLGKESPEARAARLVSGTKLGDAEVRKALWEGGAAAIAASDDPMIVYARALDANLRALEKTIDERIDAPMTAARKALSDARFAAYGDSVYPDATGTLRITYGRVGGWVEDGREIPHRTDWAGLYDRATGYAPFKLADGVAAAKDRLDLSGTLDFVYMADTIGGNSGSPVIDRYGRVLGANFDRNIHGLRNDYAYDIRMARSIAASTSAMEDGLRVIYPAPHLLKELGVE